MSIFDGLGNILGNLAEQFGGTDAIVKQVLNNMGGLDGILKQLQAGGLGGQLQSWIGTGSNAPVSPEEIANALGHGPLASLGQKLGLSPDQLSQILAQALPGFIDKVSPQGQIEPHLVESATR